MSKISVFNLGEGCGKSLGIIRESCGNWSLKHNEYYYCDECYEKLYPLFKKNLKKHLIKQHDKIFG